MLNSLPSILFSHSFSSVTPTYSLPQTWSCFSLLCLPMGLPYWIPGLLFHTLSDWQLQLPFQTKLCPDVLFMLLSHAPKYSIKPSLLYFSPLYLLLLLYGMLFFLACFLFLFIFLSPLPDLLAPYWQWPIFSNYIYLVSSIASGTYKMLSRTSLVVQWLRIRLPRQGTRVQALVREDPTCRGATKPVRHNNWSLHALELVCHNYWGCVLQLLKPTCLEPVLHSKRSHCNEKPVHRNEE